MILVGLNHNSSPVEIREKITKKFSDLETAYKTIFINEIDEPGFVISTCNRFEVYLNSSDEEGAHLKLSKFFGEALSTSEIDESVYLKKKEESINHFFMVASSLDSLVIGEPQILGQVKDSYFFFKEKGLLDSFLENLFQEAFKVAKRVRNETDIGASSVSISSVSVDLAKKIFENLNNRTAILIGAGQMAELCAQSLQKEGIKECFFINRTYEHAQELAREYDGIPIRFDKLAEYVENSDIIISSTGASHILVDQISVKKHWQPGDRSLFY